MLNTGIEVLTELDLQVFPNPASNVLFIKFNKPISNARILDLHGREVMSLGNLQGGTELNLSDLAEGIYILHAEWNRTWISERFEILH